MIYTWNKSKNTHLVVFNSMLDEINDNDGDIVMTTTTTATSFTSIPLNNNVQIKTLIHFNHHTNFQEPGTDFMGSNFVIKYF